MTDDDYVKLSKETGSTDGYINALRARIRELEQAVKDSHLLGQEEICTYRDEVRRLEAALREIAQPDVPSFQSTAHAFQDIARRALEGK